MKKKIVSLFTSLNQEPLILDKEADRKTDVIATIELVSRITGMPPDKVKILVNKYNEEHQDSYNKVNLEDYLFYEIYKMRRKGSEACDNTK